MEIFDSFYRPDTPSQRNRLVVVSVPALLSGALPWISPLNTWLAHFQAAQVAADIVATVMLGVGYQGPYPGPHFMVRAALVIATILLLYTGIKLQLRVMRDFGPGSHTLRLSKWLLAIEVLELFALYFAWPKH